MRNTIAHQDNREAQLLSLPPDGRRQGVGHDQAGCQHHALLRQRALERRYEGRVIYDVHATHSPGCYDRIGNDRPSETHATVSSMENEQLGALPLSGQTMPRDYWLPGSPVFWTREGLACMSWLLSDAVSG